MYETALWNMRECVGKYSEGEHKLTDLPHLIAKVSKHFL